jgi:hypothetical protein
MYVYWEEKVKMIIENLKKKLIFNCNINICMKQNFILFDLINIFLYLTVYLIVYWNE